MSGRACSICSHKKRVEIDKSLVDNRVSIRTISHQFAVSTDALKRHVRNGHVEEKIQKAAIAQEMAESDDLLQEVREIEGITKEIISDSRARKKKVKTEDGEIIEVPIPDNTTALKAIDSRARQIELKGKVMKLFNEGAGGKAAPYTNIPPEELARMILKGKK